MKPLAATLAILLLLSFYGHCIQSGRLGAMEADNVRLQRDSARYVRILKDMSQGQFREDREVKKHFEEVWYNTEIWSYTFDTWPPMVSH